MGTPVAIPIQRHNRLFAAIVAATVLLAAFIAWDSQSAHAITADDDVQFTVIQSPASPVIVQPGSAVTFTVDATVTLPAGYTLLFFEFDYPAGLTYVSGLSSPSGLTCTNHSPDPGIARCSYGSVITGALVQFNLTFIVTSSVTTSTGQVMMRAGPSDNTTDNASSGIGDAFGGAGSIQTFGTSNIGVANGGPYLPVFEGGTTTYSTTVTNNSGVSTGAFSTSLTFQNATVTSASCQTSSIANGAAGGSGSSVATCTGSSLAVGESLVMQAQLAAHNTASGADIVPTLAIPGLGINSAGTTIQVDEVGLDASGGLVTASQISVCTAAIGSDVANDTAAGAAQPDTGALIGSPSLNVLLQPGDFDVGGPAAGVVSAAVGCGANQSGVRFTPTSAGTYTVTANYNVGGTNTLSLAVAQAGGTATKLAFTSQPVSGAATAAFAAQPVVAIQDALNATVAGDNSTVVTLSLIAGPGTMTCTGGLSKTAVAGVAAFAGCAVSMAGSYQVRATSTPPLTQTDGTLFAVSSAPSASKLGFLAQPASAVATTAFAAQPVVAVQDPSGNTFTSDNTTVVTLSLASGPGSLTCTAGLSRTVASGVATFTGCSVSANGSGYILRATSSPVLTQADGNGFTAASNGAPAKLGYLVQPAGGGAGVAFTTQPQVAVQDASGITVSSDTTTSIALSVASGPGTLTCTGGLSKLVSGGVATFSGCYVSAQGSYVIRATSTPAYTQADTSTLTVGAGATKLGFTAQPSNGVVAIALPTQPVVAVQDAGGATVTTDNSTVVSLALTGAGTLTCTGGLSKTAVAGVATFAGCAVSAAGTGDRLTATSSPVLTSAQSTTFDVLAVATKLGFTTQPSNGVAATALPTQPVVAVQDAGGATVITDNTTVVSLALTGAGTLTCTGGLSKAVTAGVATFAGCAVSAAGTADKLTATSAPALTSAESAAFDVVVAAPTSSAQLVVGAPSAGVNVARSRLSFSATTGSLATPTSVTFVIKRKSDNKYWNSASGAWETALAENQAANGTTSWTFSITGDDRREFAGTTVIIEARAVSGGVTYTSAVTPEIAIR